MSTTVRDLAQGKCKPCEGGMAPLADIEIDVLLKQLDGWVRLGHAIVKTYHFQNYHETMAFVNASAWVSHREDHHPDLAVGYNKCGVTYTSHALGGLSENDFICAAKLDALCRL